MLRLRHHLAAAALLVASTALVAPDEADAQRASAGASSAARPERLFYYVDREESYNSLLRHVDRIDVLAPQVYTADSLGVIFGSLDPRVLDLAKRHGLRVMPLFVNEGFRQPGLHRLLGDSAARARAIESLVQLCRENGYWGMQFDVENLNVADGERFTAWYRDAAAALHRAGYHVSIAIVHRTSDLAGPTGYHRFLLDSWRGGFDLKRIAAASDFVSVMSYDQHTGRTPPGPIAGLPWTREVADYFLRSVPPEKLSLGIPLYGDYWSARPDPSPDRVRTTASSVSWSWGSGLAERNGATMRWDEVQQVPYASFEVGGTFEWVFLENARSFAAKLALMREKKLRGFSAWVLGPEDAGIWSVMGKQR